MEEQDLEYFYEDANNVYPTIQSQTRPHETDADDSWKPNELPRTNIEDFYDNDYNYMYKFREAFDTELATEKRWNYLTIVSVVDTTPTPALSLEISTLKNHPESDNNQFDTEDSLNNLQANVNNSDFLGNASSCASELLQASNSAYLYGIMFLMVVALLLNGLSIIIFRSKGLKRYAFSLYFVIIAITDTLALISYVPRKWLPVFYMALGFEDKTTFYDTNTVACKVLTYLAYVLRFLSSWLLVALGSERLLVATTPYKRSRYPTLRSTKHGFAYCSVAAIIFNAHVLFIWDSIVVPGDVTATCAPTSTSQILALGLTILTVVLIIGLPFMVVAGLTIMLVRNFKAWKLRPRRLSSSVIARALFEKDATVMVVSVLGSYTLLCVPYIITWIVLLWQHFLNELPLCRYLDGAAARDVAEVGFMINFAIKFLLCIMFGNHVLSQK